MAAAVALTLAVAPAARAVINIDDFSEGTNTKVVPVGGSVCQYQFPNPPQTDCTDPMDPFCIPCSTDGDCCEMPTAGCNLPMGSGNYGSCIQIPAPQIFVNQIGCKSAFDSGLLQAIGGVRKVAVTATEIDGASEDVIAGVLPGMPPMPGMCYNSTNGANGTFALRYDGNPSVGMGCLLDVGGPGLGADLSQAVGIQVQPKLVDPGFSGGSVTYTLTLKDGQGNGAQVTKTDPQSCLSGCSSLLFPFSSFPGVNPKNIASIDLLVDPTKAADLELDYVATYGVAVHPVPVVSSRSLGAIGVLLVALGLAGIARSRRVV
jgi:hypothetical protein